MDANKEGDMKPATMRYLALALVVLSPVVLTPTQAKAVMIKGSVNCGNWLKAREQKNAGHFEWYLIGVLNMLAVERKQEFWQAGGVNIDATQVEYWIDNYCKDNPLDSVLAGAEELFVQRTLVTGSTTSSPKQ